MTDLIKKIDRAIEEKAMKTGKMGTESITVTLSLSDDEMKEFESIEKYDSENYFWEKDGNELTITYTEEV